MMVRAEPDFAMPRVWVPPSDDRLAARAMATAACRVVRVGMCGCCVCVCECVCVCVVDSGVAWRGRGSNNAHRGVTATRTTAERNQPKRTGAHGVQVPVCLPSGVAAGTVPRGRGGVLGQCGARSKAVFSREASLWVFD